MFFSSQAICLRLSAFSKTKRPQRDLQVFFSLLLSCMLTLCNKTGRKTAWALPNKARSSHRSLQSFQLMQKGRRPPEPRTVTGKHMVPPGRHLGRLLWGAAGSNYCVCTHRENRSFFMTIMLYLLPFWRRQLQRLQSKALGTVKHLLLALLPFALYYKA